MVPAGSTLPWKRSWRNADMDCNYVTLCLLMFPVVLRADMSAEGELVKSLFANYSSDTRPVQNFFESLNVNMKFQLAKIEQLDEKMEQMITLGWLSMEWQDAYLTWDPVAVGNIPHIMIPSSKIWRPEVALLNSMEAFTDLSYNTNSRAMVRSNGLVVWLLGSRWVTHCSVDLRYFPFDTQVCFVRFINWVHSEFALNFSSGLDHVTLDMYEENGEWNLLKHKTFRESISFQSQTQGGPIVSLPSVGFYLVMERNPNYSVYNIMLPVFVLAAMSTLVFALPSESGEKVSMQVTVLLAFSVLLLVISDTTPRSSKTMPLLTVIITGSMSLTAVSLITTVLILNVYHRSGNRAVPRHLKAIFFQFVAKIICMDIEACHRKVKVISASKLENRDSEETDGVCTVPNQDPLPDYVRDFIMRKIENSKANNIAEGIKEDWQKLSRILDRTFLVLYITSILGLAIVTMVQLVQPHDVVVNTSYLK